MAAGVYFEKVFQHLRLNLIAAGMSESLKKVFIIKHLWKADLSKRAICSVFRIGTKIETLKETKFLC